MSNLISGDARPDDRNQSQHRRAQCRLGHGEGVMGLFDGARGGGSTTDVAVTRYTRCPGRGCERTGPSAAALVHGFDTFDRILKLPA